MNMNRIFGSFLIIFDLKLWFGFVCSNVLTLFFPERFSVGKDLMRIDAFANSMNNSATILAKNGTDLNKLLGPNNPSIFDSIYDSLVTISALQVNFSKEVMK